MTERVKFIFSVSRALPRRDKWCWRLHFCLVAECFIQKAGLVLWSQPLFHGGAGWCDFLKSLLRVSPQLVGVGGSGNGEREGCFVTFLQGKHRWSQGQTTGEDSWALIQSLWGVTCTSERRPGKRAHCPVFWHHGDPPSLFGGCGPSSGKPKARLLPFPDDHERTELFFSHTPRKVVLASEEPLFLLGQVTNSCWLIKV